MAKILGFNEATYIALHCMGLMAVKNGCRVSINEVAGVLGVSETHLAKVVLRLSRSELISTVRGPKGGAVLAKDVKDISFLDIVEAMEGPIGDDGCVFGREQCVYGSCMFKGFISKVTQETLEWLKLHTLEDFINSTAGRESNEENN